MTLLETARFNAAANRAKRVLEDAMEVCSAEIERINAARVARGVAPLDFTDGGSDATNYRWEKLTRKGWIAA